MGKPAKLTDEQVLEILKEYRDNRQITQRELAKRYDVSLSLIQHLLGGRFRFHLYQQIFYDSVF